MTDRDPLEWLIGIIGMRNIFAHCSQCGDEFDTMGRTDRVEYSVGPSKKHPGMKAAYAVKLV